MTGREKIAAMVRQLRADSDRCQHVAQQLISRALTSQEYADKLELLAEQSDDRQVEAAVADVAAANLQAN